LLEKDMANVKSNRVKIALTVSQSLYYRLQQLEDRISVSEICREALEKAIIKEENQTKDTSDLHDLIKRLSIEKGIVEKQDNEIGFRDGRTRALRFSYLDFKVIERISEAIKRYGQGVRVEDVVNSVLHDLNMDFIQLFWADDGALGFTNRESYLKGYIEGVIDLWTEVSEKI
jgi:hypothetical protein